MERLECVLYRHPTASVRQLEALLRLSEANAKLRLSEAVTEADAAEAVRLLHVATLQSLVDPFSGTPATPAQPSTRQKEQTTFKEEGETVP